MQNTVRTYLVTLTALIALSLVSQAQDIVVFQEALYSGSIGSQGSQRSAVFTDPILARYAAGTLTAPQAGEVSGETARGQTVRWKRLEADASGAFTDRSLRSGTLYLTCDSESDRIAVLQTNGNSEILVNGTPRAGDNYSKGWIMLPVQLKQGKNEFWLKIGRGGRKTLNLSSPPKPVFLTGVDMTVPDLLTHEINDKLAAIRIVNATEHTLDGLTLRSTVAGTIRNTRLSGPITPLTSRKVPYTLHDGAFGAGPQAVQVELYQGDRLLDEIDFTIQVKEPSQPYKRTFVSEIDGSLQYYGVRQGQAEPGKRPAMFLSTHGAGVEGIGQAAAYQPKTWGHVIAPTNRREFGFDWEDWGRLDALEALAHAEALYGTDPVRTYLTGHSMGGHGAWYLGATYPDRWAAIAPMAGWRSFFSYVGIDEFAAQKPMAAMFNRAANPSRTEALLRNYAQHGVFIEHGDNDQTVPVREARTMRELLGAFHPDMAYYEQPGGGHWYGVDHQRVFDFLKWHQKKAVQDVPVLEFRSVSPGVSATSAYITLYQQERPYDFCGVVARQAVRSRQRQSNNINERNISVTTDNLAVFKIDLTHFKDLQGLALEVDGQAIDNLPWPQRNEVWLKREGTSWRVIPEAPGPEQKNPVRYGGFKDAFRHRMIFVYATGGTPEENAWSYDKARFDAETFYYRGNGAVDILPDHAFAAAAFPDRSVILFGNASTNLAWPGLLGDCPVQIRRGVLDAGGRRLTGDGWGVTMVRPRPDSDIASVGVVAGTGLPGMRAVTPNRYFVAGTGFPDLMIVSPDMFTWGVDGVKAAGYFGNDWTLEHGSVVWSED
ncbi:MAG: prolyl oligopeptidase family serine peptidase [Phycisphaerae bacterium]|nr:prolyl oligopeptidase family serine peptidase [Phycisphaerae bacterium]